jgi:hypothetical protein
MEFHPFRGIAYVTASTTFEKYEIQSEKPNGSKGVLANKEIDFISGSFEHGASPGMVRSRLGTVIASRNSFIYITNWVTLGLRRCKRSYKSLLRGVAGLPFRFYR